MADPHDTIAAIATPAGEGGIGVIRISGGKTLDILRALFRRSDGESGLIPRHAHHGEIRDPADHGVLDEVLVTWFRSPRSYTGEDVAEISAHGGMYLIERILRAVLRSGARLAEPGEFTRRAFLNGRMDLSQAEAVADVIAAQSDAALRSALSQLRGRLSERINRMYGRLVGVLAQLEAAMDFPEDGLTFADPEKLLSAVRQTRAEAGSLADTWREGKIRREGARFVLVGKPNSGKSSLLNALLREDRAIVTPHPGTTRDLLEERVRIRDIHIVLTDSAGIRNRPETIEAEGIARTRRALEEADAALVLLDGSRTLDADDLLLLETVGDRPRVVAVNKCDLPQQLEEADLQDRNIAHAIRISAKTEAGLQTLIDAIYDTALRGARAPAEAAVITRERHRDLLVKTGEALERAEASLEQRLPEEMIAVDLNQALDHLGSLIGKTVAEDVLDAIFNEFCIGK